MRSERERGVCVGGGGGGNSTHNTPLMKWSSALCCQFGSIRTSIHALGKGKGLFVCVCGGGGGGGGGGQKNSTHNGQLMKWSSALCSEFSSVRNGIYALEKEGRCGGREGEGQITLNTIDKYCRDHRSFNGI